MNFDNKQQLIDFVKDQLNVELKSEEPFDNEYEELFYTKFPKERKGDILNLFYKYGIETNEHVNNKYWIYLINEEKVDKS
jgi:hypothetical protein